MATPHVDDLLKAAADVREYCSEMGVDFQARLPVRKKARERLNLVDQKTPSIYVGRIKRTRGE